MVLTVTGVVINANSDTISRFVCDSMGMGLFAMMPAKGETYYAIITQGKARHKIVLPRALQKGLSVSIRRNDTLLNVIVTCNEAGMPDYRGHQFTVAGRHGGLLLFKQKFQLTDNRAVIKVPENMFPEGISAITLYDDQSKPHSERLVYVHHPTKNINTIGIATDKITYQPKQKVTLKIRSTPKTEFSLAVVDADIVPVQAVNIQTYLMLQSELKGSIEHPERYFDTTNINRFKQIDLLLMTQGWRDFVWRRVVDTAIRISYQTENGIDITGKVKNELNRQPLQGLNVTLYASAARGDKLFSAITDASGGFAFTGLPYYGERTVKLASVNSKGEKRGTFYMDTVSILNIHPVGAVAPATINDTIPASAIITLVKRRKVNLSGVTHLKEVTIKASRIVPLANGTFMNWGPDQTFDITPKDFQFKTLEWYLLQNCKGAMQSNLLDKEHNPITGVVFAGIDTVLRIPPESYGGSNVLMPPQFFVNGRDYFTDNDIEAEAYRSTYFPMPIDKFKKVVLKRVAGTLINAEKLGARMVLVDRYVLYLTLKEDAMMGYNQGSLRPVVKGYYEARMFYKPLYDTPKNLNKPDYRTTIHWEPNITTDDKGDATVTYYNPTRKPKLGLLLRE